MPVYQDQFKQYKGKNKIYIETGSLEGASIDKALDAGYEEIHAIEADVKYFDFCTNKFKDNKKVAMHLGDSGKMLAEVLKSISEPCTIFLDAHFGVIPNAEYTPLMSELEAIKKYGNPNCHILIDDIRLLKDNENQIPWTKQEIESKLLEINPKYKIVYEQGFCENDIMVAYVEGK